MTRLALPAVDSACGLPREPLLEAARRFGSPLYVYDLDVIAARFAMLRDSFAGRFRVSFAVKANPNPAVLAGLARCGADFDASSLAEIKGALQAGADPSRISFTGPAKREAEIAAAVTLRIGTMVLESSAQAETANRFAERAGIIQSAVIRINPNHVPRGFGARMNGKASQFGIDEDCVNEAMARIAALPHLSLDGFHIYSGSGCLDETALNENFDNAIRLFKAFGSSLKKPIRKLIFGAGFGIPYYPDQQALRLGGIAEQAVPMIDALRATPGFAEAECSLELGRWLSGPAGWLLTSVVAAKSAGETEIRMCDAGFNTHLAACGMMGSILRKAWRMSNLSNPGGGKTNYTLVGPLCTSIDQLGRDVPLTELRIGDVIAIENSGAYGLTASPTRFISHPEPREAAFVNGGTIDVTVIR